MSNRISRNLEAKGTLGRRSDREDFLVFALGFIVISQQAILKAQDPAQGSNRARLLRRCRPHQPHPLLLPPSDEYLINPDDVLDVYVYDVPELSHTYTVSPSGVCNRAFAAHARSGRRVDA